MFLLQRVPISQYISALIILWGLVLAVTAEGKNFSQLAALRFLLGFFEAGIYPCCIMIISTMYRRREQAGRLVCSTDNCISSVSFDFYLGHRIHL